MLRQALMEWAVKQRWKKTQISEDYDVEVYLKRIPEYFDPTKISERRRLTVVYDFHNSGKNDGSWTVTIADGKCNLARGSVEQYDTRLYMTAETYRRILSGRLDHDHHAYSTGAIRFFGNTLGHRELNSYLTLPKKAGVACL